MNRLFRILKNPEKTFLCILFLASSGLYAQKQTAEWFFETDGFIFSSISLSENVLYIGSMDSIFYALDTSGKKKWEFNSHYSIQSTALVFDSIVCFQSGNRLYGLNKNTGVLLWTHEPDEVKGKKPVIMVDEIDFKDSSPILEGSIAYYGNEYGKFYGVNIYSGEEVYLFDTERGYPITSTATIINDTAYFGDMEGYVYAVRISNSTLIWDMRTYDGVKIWGGFGPIIGKLVAEGDLLYFGIHNGLLQVLNRYSGAIEWTYGNPATTWYSGTPVVKDNVMYMGTSDSKQFIAFNATTGTKIWDAAIGRGMYNSCVFYENHIIAIGGYNKYEELTTKGSGRLNVLDMNGKVVTTLELPGSVFNTPVILDRKLYYGCNDGNIYCLNLDNIIESTITSNENNVFNKVSTTVYPNPFNDVLHVNHSGIGNSKIEFYNLNGKLIKTKNLSTSSSQINLASATSVGEYIIYRIVENNNQHSSGILVRQ